MRILFFHQFFRTPEEGGGIRSFYIANSLIKRGHHVTVITAESLEVREFEPNQKDLRIIRLPVKWSNSMSFYQRLKAFFRFLWLARKESKKHEFDMVYAISVPLTTGLLAIWTKKPFVFEVGDLWPDVPIQMGILRNPVLKYFSFRLEKRIYAKAELIISLSKDIQSHIYKKWPFTPNIVIENFSDSEIFNSAETTKEHSKYIICTYVGTAGVANDLMQIIELARAAEIDHPIFQFQLMIDGKEKELIVKNAPGNVYFKKYGSKAEVAELLTKSDFNFVCYAQYPLLGSGSPNKFFDGIAAGCVTVINVPGWINDLIQAEDAGLFWNVNNNGALINEMFNIYSNSHKIQQIKSNSKKLAERFEMDLLSNRIVDQIELRF